MEKRKELSLPDEQKAILVFDVFKGQKTERVQSLIADNNCISVFVPANMTNYFQPLDLTVNGHAKYGKRNGTKFNIKFFNHVQQARSNSRSYRHQNQQV